MSKTHHAYPKMPEVETVMRLQAVKRWHMIETTRTQTLAEHTANVALLAWLIAQTSPGIFLQPLACMASAMAHDLGEAFLGDIPTHSKRTIGKQLIEAAEEAILPKVFNPLSRSSDDCLLLVKLCDLADGIRFIRLHGVDATARHAQEGLEQQFVARLRETQHWFWRARVKAAQKLIFYAYEYDTETGDSFAQGTIPEHVREVVDDMARGQGDQSGGSGCELCHEGGLV